MKVLTKSIMVVFIIILAVSGCSENDIRPIQQLKFDLVVLDKNGVKTNRLIEGEDFFLGFEVSNNSKDTVFVSHEGGNRLFQQFYKQGDFLSIYRKNGVKPPVYVGKPYDPDVEINFPDINLPGYFLNVPPSGRQYTFRFSWLNYPINRPLPAGTYYSSFSDAISVEGVEVIIDTAIEFEVK